MVMFVTIRDVYQVNKMGGILCEMSLGSETKYSHVVDFKQQGNGKSSLFQGISSFVILLSLPQTPPSLCLFSLLFLL